MQHMKKFPLVSQVWLVLNCDLRLCNFIDKSDYPEKISLRESVYVSYLPGHCHLSCPVWKVYKQELHCAM